MVTRGTYEMGAVVVGRAVGEWVLGVEDGSEDGGRVGSNDGIVEM